jgi:exopolyphosphatase/guanosine-5'-triphosphate,3'-diphosphate pyrophosphatase
LPLASRPEPSSSEHDKFFATREPIVSLGASIPHGVLDLGSNSVCFEIYNEICRWPDRLYPPTKDQCGIGKGTSEHNLRLNESGKTRALEHLEVIGEMIRDITIEKNGGREFPIDIFATAAIRNAVADTAPTSVRLDAQQFLRDAEVRLGFRPPDKTRDAAYVPPRSLAPISSQEEGKRTAGGVISSIPNADGLVIDIGGNSAEIVRVYDGNIIRHGDLPMGTLSSIDGKEIAFEDRTNLVHAKLNNVKWLHEFRERPVKIYLVGGAPRALGRFGMLHDNYPMRKILHNFAISAGDILNYSKDIRSRSVRDLRMMDDDISGRASTLHAAAAFGQALAKYFPQSSYVFSSYGVREGTAFWQLLPEQRWESPLTYAAAHYFQQHISPQTPKRIQAWLQPLLESLQEKTRPREVVIEAVCILSNFKAHDMTGGRADTAFDEIMGYEFGDLSHKERLTMAVILNTYYGGVLAEQNGIVQRMNLLAPNELAAAQSIGTALHIADRLGRATPLLNKTSLDVIEGRVELCLDDGFPLPGHGHIDRHMAKLGHYMQREAKVVTPAESTRRGRDWRQSALLRATA